MLWDTTLEAVSFAAVFLGRCTLRDNPKKTAAKETSWKLD